MIRTSVLLVSFPILAAMAVAQAPVPAVTYYVSNGGNDLAAGTSPSTPWRTLNRVQQVQNLGSLHAGDAILLERGSTFDEGFELKLSTHGTNTARMTLGDYGNAAQPATISRRSTNGLPICVSIHGEYWVVKGLRFEVAHNGLLCVGNVSPTRGVEVIDCTFRNIDNRSDYRYMPAGIGVTGSGFRQLTIRGCVFDHVGLGVQVATGQMTQGMTIAQCEAFGGWGAGFALQNVTDSLVSEFVVRDTGGQSNVGTTAGFLVNCTNVQVDRCSFSGVRHSGGPDGCGFDFEGGNVDCSLTNCMIFDNEGPAILMFSNGAPNTNITVANCLFYNNNRRLHNGAPEADCVLHLAVGTVGGIPGAPFLPSSTGTISNCGIYKPNVTAVGFTGADPHGTWSGFSRTNVTAALQCDGWIPVLGRMRHVSVGRRNHICAVGFNQLPYEWTGAPTGDAWRLIAGLTGVDTISVGDDGELWATDLAHNVYRYAGLGSWTLMPGSMAKVSVGSANNIWSLDASTGGPSRPNQWVNGNWVRQGTTLMTDIDAGPTSGEAWAVSGTTVYQFRSNWSVVPGINLNQISLHGRSPIYQIAAGVLGTTVKRTVDGINYDTLPGSLVEVAEGSDATLWGVDANGYVWRAR